MSKIKYFLGALALLPSVALAQALPVDNPGLPGAGSENIQTLVGQIISNIILPTIGIICVLFIIIGGFQYITSAGNDELAARGKKTLTNAIIGLVVVILSYVIVVVISNTLA